MKRKIYPLAIVLLSCIATFGQNPEQTDQIIIKLKNEVAYSSGSFNRQKFIGNNKIDHVNQNFHSIEIKRQSLGIKSKQYIYIVKFPEGTNIQQIIDEYYDTGEIEYAEPDYIGYGGGTLGIIPNDEYYYKQWALKNDGSFSLSPSIEGADIDMENAWSIEQGDSNIVVAIIDSGVKLDHPEFSGRIWRNLKEIPNNGIDDDNNGYIDDVVGWNFVSSTNNPTDDLWHGTFVTGIIGATGNNNTGFAGVDWNCKLMILKGLNDSNFGNFSWWSDAIYYAVDNGANVINMSLSSPEISITLHSAVLYALSKNVVIVAGMSNTNSNTIRYPAGYPGVIAVGATNSNDLRSSPFYWGEGSGSSYGSHISVVAPGNFIFSLYYQSDTSYNYYGGGTSMAAPHVSGLASLLLAQDPNRTPQQIKSIIEATAEDQVGDPIVDIPGWDQYYGHGRINAFNALSFLSFEANNVHVFPNPTNQHFTITFPFQTRQIQISNSLGQLITSKNIRGQTTQNFELDDSGIYFIRVSSEEQTISKKVIVVK